MRRIALLDLHFQLIHPKVQLRDHHCPSNSPIIPNSPHSHAEAPMWWHHILWGSFRLWMPPWGKEYAAHMGQLRPELAISLAWNHGGGSGQKAILSQHLDIKNPEMLSNKVPWGSRQWARNLLSHGNRGDMQVLSLWLGKLSHLSGAITFLNPLS